MKRSITFLLMFIFTLSAHTAYTTEEREIIKRQKTESVKIRFNGETIKGFYLLLDFRTDEEKQKAVEKGSPGGDIIIFLHGHGQRPGDGYKLTSNLALKSKSGIVIIPVCDTPFGSDKKWRGDRGKEVILMEMARYALREIDIEIKNFIPLTDKKIRITPSSRRAEPLPEASGRVKAGVSLMGWSHGGLLTRRLAHSYPDAVNSIVQMAPAGYREWGRNACTRSTCILTRFSIEGTRIGFGIFRGEGGTIFRSSTGIVRGVGGDTLRSCSSCIVGNFHPLKPFRALKDMNESAEYATDKKFPLPRISYVTVIFSGNDSLFRVDHIDGVENRREPTLEEKEIFFEEFYASAVKGGAVFNLEVLPGNHIGPAVHGKKYSYTALKTINELRAPDNRE